MPPNSGEAGRTCLVVTSERGLSASLGGRRAAEVLGLLERLAESRRASGIAHLLYVPDRVPPSGGLPSLEPPITAGALAGALRALEEDRYSGEPVGYLWLIGDHRVIPFHSVENPAADSDAAYPSDAPYGVAGEPGDADAQLIPDRAVGRLPLAAGGGGDLCASIERLLEPQVEGERGRPFGLGAADWRDQAARVYGLISDAPLLTSPPLDIGGFKPEWLGPRTVHYFNVHGSRDDGFWYGQKGLDFPRVLSPEAVAGSDPAGSLAVCEACYGGLVVGKTAETSIALRFLAGGCSAFVGSSAIAYGSPDSRLSEADLLAYLFLKRVVAGERCGDAFREGKVDFAAEMLRRQGYLDGDDKKTLTEFNLFGDPTFRAVGAGPGRGRGGMISEDVIEAIKRLVASKFPEMEGVEPDLAEETAARGGSLAKKVLARRPQSGQKAAAGAGQRVFVASFARLVISGERSVQRVVRVTFDNSGQVLKVVTSK